VCSSDLVARLETYVRAEADRLGRTMRNDLTM